MILSAKGRGACAGDCASSQIESKVYKTIFLTKGSYFVPGQATIVASPEDRRAGSTGRCQKDASSAVTTIRWLSIMYG
jgi:hypothetical protein